MGKSRKSRKKKRKLSGNEQEITDILEHVKLFKLHQPKDELYKELTEVFPKKKNVSLLSGPQFYTGEFIGSSVSCNVNCHLLNQNLQISGISSTFSNQVVFDILDREANQNRSQVSSKIENSATCSDNIDLPIFTLDTCIKDRQGHLFLDNSVITTYLKNCISQLSGDGYLRNDDVSTFQFLSKTSQMCIRNKNLLLMIHHSAYLDGSLATLLNTAVQSFCRPKQFDTCIVFPACSLKVAADLAQNFDYLKLDRVIQLQDKLDDFLRRLKLLNGLCSFQYGRLILVVGNTSLTSMHVPTYYCRVLDVQQTLSLLKQ